MRVSSTPVASFGKVRCTTTCETATEAVQVRLDCQFELMAGSIIRAQEHFIYRVRVWVHNLVPFTEVKSLPQLSTFKMGLKPFQTDAPNEFGSKDQRDLLDSVDCLRSQGISHYVIATDHRVRRPVVWVYHVAFDFHAASSLTHLK